MAVITEVHVTWYRNKSSC